MLRLSGTEGAVLPPGELEPDGEARTNRLDWAAKRWLHDNSSLPSVVWCGMKPLSCGTRSKKVGVFVRNRRGNGRACFSGLTRCGSVWSCPVCSARLWAARRDELGAVVAGALSEGLQVGMVTLTLRHDSASALPELLDGLAAGWRSSQQSRRVREASKALGVVGFVRRTEITHGHRNGWHPHLHILIVAANDQTEVSTELPWTELLWNEFADALREQWIASAESLGLKAPSAARGLHLKVFDFAGSSRRSGSEEIASRYLTKGGSFLGAVGEFVDSDGKRAKNHNRTSWELLAAAMSGRRSARERWGVYEQATKGRRPWAVSASLRQLAARHPQKEEEELTEHCLGFIDADGWAKMVSAHRNFGELLTTVNEGWVAGFLKTGAERGALLQAQAALAAKLDSWNVGQHFLAVKPLETLAIGSLRGLDKSWASVCL